MTRAAIGLSTALKRDRAMAELLDALDRGLAGAMPSAALLLTTAALGSEAAIELQAALSRELGPVPIAGSEVAGVMASELIPPYEGPGRAPREVHQLPAAALIAWTELAGEAFVCETPAGRPEELGREITARLAASRCEADELVVLLPCSIGVAAAPLIDGLRVNPSARVVGAAASGTAGEYAAVWADGQALRGGCAVMRLAVTRSTYLSVSSGARTHGEPHRITRARGNWVLGLSGRPALEVYREALPVALRDDLERASRSRPVGLMAAAPSGGGMQLRNVVGFDAARGAFALPHAVSSGGLLALASIDETVAREQLIEALARTPGRIDSSGLYFCHDAGPGGRLGHEGLEIGYLAAHLPDHPILGMTGAYQLVSAQGAPCGAIDLHTYGGVLALL